MRSGLANITAGVILAALAAATINIMTEMPGQFTLVGIDFRIVLGLAVVCGLALAAWGAYRTFGPLPKPAQRARADAQLIFRAMIALAGTDGDLHPDELLMIQRCCARFFGRELGLSEIRQAFETHQRTNYAGFAFDGADQTASAEARSFALAAAILAAGADGAETPAEQEKLGRLAALLGLPAEAQSAARAEAGRIRASFATGDPGPSEPPAP